VGDLARQPARGLLSTLALQPHRWFTRLLLICAGFSGAAALVYQVVWHRQFLLLFGSTTAATAAVIAAFMGGLALGAVCLGQYAHRISAPLLVYAGLEVAIALYALIFPEILPVAELLYTSLWRLVEDQPLLINGLRLGLGLVMLVPPTIALGSTLPLLVRILMTSVQDRSQVVGWIYGINAGGGAVGAVTAGLLLFGSHRHLSNRDWTQLNSGHRSYSALAMVQSTEVSNTKSTPRYIKLKFIISRPREYSSAFDVFFVRFCRDGL